MTSTGYFLFQLMYANLIPLWVAFFEIGPQLYCSFSIGNWAMEALVYDVVQPSYNHWVTFVPGMSFWGVLFWFSQTPINKYQFIIWPQSIGHHLTPISIIVSRESNGVDYIPWIVRTAEIVRWLWVIDVDFWRRFLILVLNVVLVTHCKCHTAEVSNLTLIPWKKSIQWENSLALSP